MAGLVKIMIDKIIQQRSHGNPTLAVVTKTKFILKGLNPDDFGRTSPDDPAIVTKVKAIAAEMGVSV